METFTFLFTTSFYPPYHIGGAGVHVKYLAEELVKLGHEVHVIHSLDAYKVKRKSSPKAENTSRVFVHTLKSPLGKLSPVMVYTLGNSRYIQNGFSRVIKKIHPDVVHHHNISLLGYKLLKRRAKYVSLYTAHDYWLICPTNNLLKNKKDVCTKKSCFFCSIRSYRSPQLWRYGKDFRDAISNIDLIISPSEYLRKRLMEEIKVKSITLNNFVPLPPKNISPSMYLNYFLFVGMLEKHKGILNLLKIFKHHSYKKDAKLLIVGSGSLKSKIQRYILLNNLQEKVIMLGWQSRERLYSLYKDAIVLVLPSICPENGPLTVLEAMSVGTPSIVSNLGGSPEYIEKLSRDLIFNHNNMNQLKNILLRFSKNEFPPEKIKKVHEQNFSPKIYIYNYLKVIQSIGK